MSDKDKKETLSWDDFVKLGNPDNVPDQKEEDSEDQFDPLSVVRIFLEKKRRNGKTASVIKGIDADEDHLKELAKLLKSSCGVGGSVKDGYIIIQGNHRDKISKILSDKGYKNVKLAGG
jgi:translation initiation factor 1